MAKIRKQSFYSPTRFGGKTTKLSYNQFFERIRFSINSTSNKPCFVNGTPACIKTFLQDPGTTVAKIKADFGFVALMQLLCTQKLVFEFSKQRLLEGVSLMAFPIMFLSDVAEIY